MGEIYLISMYNTNNNFANIKTFVSLSDTPPLITDQGDIFFLSGIKLVKNRIRYRFVSVELDYSL